jgi:hypothetical protein
LAPLPGLDLKTPYLVIAFRNANTLAYFGHGSHLVCQVMPACSSTLYPDMGDYEEQTMLSPPAALPLNHGV